MLVFDLTEAALRPQYTRGFVPFGPVVFATCRPLWSLFSGSTRDLSGRCMPRMDQSPVLGVLGAPPHDPETWIDVEQNYEARHNNRTGLEREQNEEP